MAPLSGTTNGDPSLHFPLARAGIFGLAYFALAQLGHGLSLETQDQVFATFWPPAGLFLATLVQTRYRFWPALMLIACGATLASDALLQEKSVPMVLGFCAANCGAAGTGAWLLRRFVGVPFTLARLKDVLGLACFAALLSSMLGAAIGAAVVKAAFSATSYWSAWQLWWIGDAVGVLVFAPVVFTWSAERATMFQGIRPWRVVETIALFLGLMLVTESVFGDLLPAPLTVPGFILPFILWAGLRFRPSCAATALLVVALIGLWNISHGRGPYAVLTTVPSEQLLRAQASLCAFSLSVMALVAAVAERKQAEQQRIKLIAELEQALNEIKTLRGLIPLCAWCKKIRDDRGYWQRLEDYLLANTAAVLTHGMCPECLEKELAALPREEADR